MNISNQYLETLADQLGDVRERIKQLEEQEAHIKDEFLTHASDVPVVGLRWTATKSETTSSRLDTKAVRDLLGERVKQYEKPTKSTTIRVKQTMVFGKTAAE